MPNGRKAIRRRSLDDVDLHARIAGGKARDDGRKDAGSEKIAPADVDAADLQLFKVAQIVQKPVLQVHVLLDDLNVFLPAFRQTDGIRAAVEDRGTDAVLDAFDRDAERRLGDEQVLRCLGEASFLIDFIDVFGIAEHGGLL